MEAARAALNPEVMQRIQANITKAEVEAARNLYQAVAAEGRGGAVAVERAAYIEDILRLWKQALRMLNLHLKLPLQNESSSPLTVLLEPLSEYFIVQPGQRVEVHGICADETDNPSFTVAADDSGLIVYAPGEVRGFVDCYVTCQGVRLKPDGN